MFRGRQVIVWAMTFGLLSTEALAAKPRAASPANNPGDWVTPDDYPPDALRSSQSGISAFTVDIDATGAPTRCAITGSSGSASLDEAACRNVVARARFKPAMDKKGHTIAGSFSTAVRWSIPQDDDTPPAAIPGCSMQNDEAIRVSGLPACSDIAKDLAANPQRGVTVARPAKGLICTVDIDGKTRELQDGACAAIDKSLERAGVTLPATTTVRWTGGFPLKGG